MIKKPKIKKVMRADSPRSSCHSSSDTVFSLFSSEGLWIFSITLFMVSTTRKKDDNVLEIFTCHVYNA